MYHTTLQATSGQHVFMRDLILNTSFVEDWGAIMQRTQKSMDKTNQLKNKIANRTLIEYRIEYKCVTKKRIIMSSCS